MWLLPRREPRRLIDGNRNACTCPRTRRYAGYAVRKPFYRVLGCRFAPAIDGQMARSNVNNKAKGAGRSLKKREPLAAQSGGVVDKLPCVVFVCRVSPGDHVPVYSYVGAGVEHVLGVDAETILRDPAARYRHALPEDAPRLQHAVHAQDGALTEEFRVRIDGEILWIEGRA